VKDTTRQIGHQAAKLRDYLSLFQLRSTCMLILSVMLMGLGVGITSAVFVFFFVTLKDIPVTQISLMLGGFFVVNVCAAPVWAKFGNLVGKHRALAIGCLGTMTYQIAIGFMPPGNFIYLTVVFVFGGFCAGTADLFPRAMMADVSDEDKLAVGFDRTGMLYAVLSLTTKMGQALAIGLVYTFLKFIGFSATAGKGNSHEALLWVLLLGSAIPAVIYFVGAMFAYFYPLTAKRHGFIRDQLKLKHMASSADVVSETILAADIA